jgi:hypothetical protein
MKKRRRGRKMKQRTERKETGKEGRNGKEGRRASVLLNGRNFVAKPVHDLIDLDRKGRTERKKKQEREDER